MNLKNPHSVSRLELVKMFMPSIRYWARFYSHHGQRVLNFDDLVTVGIIGLIDAVGKFKIERQNQFKTYAEFRIRGEIIDELRRHDWVSRSDRRKQKTLRKAEQALGQELGRNPTLYEISKAVPFQSEELSRVQSIEHTDAPYTFKDNDTMSAGQANNMVHDLVERRDMMAYFLKKLPSVYQSVMAMRYFEDLGLAEIAKRLNLSEGRISQIHAESLKLLKGFFQSEKEDLMVA